MSGPEAAAQRAGSGTTKERTGFGAFGKMPALGDFFRLELPQAFVDPWDGFLQGAVAAGKETFGPLWLERYMTAPIWRFALAPGMAGPEAVAGVLMPSVDRVGRQFPLTLAASFAPAPPLRLLAAQQPVLEALELVALDALDDATTRELLAARLAAIRPLALPPPARLRRSAGGLVGVGGGSGAQLLSDLALAGAPGGAVFLTSVEGASRLLVLPGFPEGAAAAALFDLDAPFWGEAAQ